MVVLPGNRGELRLLEFSAEDRVPDEAMLLLLLLLLPLLLLLLLLLLPLYRCR